MIGQQVFFNFLENGAVVPAEMDIVIQGIRICTQIQGISPEIIMIHQRYQSENHPEKNNNQDQPSVLLQPSHVIYF